MAANKYAVTLDTTINSRVRDGVQGAVVVAESSADAKALLKSLYAGQSNVAWENATYALMAAAADLEGWQLRIQVIKVSDDSVTVDVTVTGAASATVDSIATLAATALNATSPIAGAAYNSSTNVLKVAETTDNLGDHRVYAFMTPPGSSIAIPGFVGSIVDAGSAGDALTVALAADSYTVPKVTAQFGEKFGG